MNAPLAFMLGLALCSPLSMSAQELVLAEAGAARAQTAEERDGQQDFDFAIGVWKTQVSRLQQPLTGSTTWVDYEGTSAVRALWKGRANIVELNIGGPAGRIEGISLRLYNPRSRQWSIHYASSNGGAMSPPVVGEFRNGRGEFFGQETLDGRVILVKFIMTNIAPDTWRYEQSFSDDGGETWETNWIAVDVLQQDGIDD